MTDEQQGQPPTGQRSNTGDIIESVITKGDLGKLTPTERTLYYREVCNSIGLNPLTQPFAYITLNGKLTLYALKGATDQLRTNRNVSVEEISETISGGVLVTTCKVRDEGGRTDVAKGAVSIEGLKGESLANAIMKAETKAKRRATLSICGLGMLDESEIEGIPAEELRAPPPSETISPEQIERLNALATEGNADLNALCAWLRVSHIGEIAAKDFAKAEKALQAKLAETRKQQKENSDPAAQLAAPRRDATPRISLPRNATSSSDIFGEREPGEEG